MQAVHELGTSWGLAHRRASGPGRTSSADHLPHGLGGEPRPLAVAGPVRCSRCRAASALALGGRARLPGAFVLRFFAGFCLIANGAYSAAERWRRWATQVICSGTACSPGALAVRRADDTRGPEALAWARPALRLGAEPDEVHPASLLESGSRARFWRSWVGCWKVMRWLEDARSQDGRWRAGKLARSAESRFSANGELLARHAICRQRGESGPCRRADSTDNGRFSMNFRSGAMA